MLTRAFFLCLIAAGAAFSAQDCVTEAGAWGEKPSKDLITLGTAIAYTSGSTLIIEDNSDPALPKRLGSLVLPGSILTLAGNGFFLYAVYWEPKYYNLRVAAVDIGDPQRPVLCGVSPVAESDYYDPRFIRLIAEDSRLYAYGQGWGVEGLDTWYYFGFITVLDVSDPLHPVIAGYRQYWTEWYNHRVGITSMILSPPFAFLGAHDGIHVVNVSDPMNMPEVGFSPTEARVTSLAQAGPYLYVGSDALIVMDVGDPTLPNPVARLDDQAGILSLLADRGRLFCASGNAGVSIMDLSLPIEPAVLSNYSGPLPILDVRVREDWIYALVGIEDDEEPRGFQVLDARDASAPSFVREYAATSDLMNLFLSGALVYALDGLGMVRVFDLTAPSILSEAGTAPLSYPALAGSAAGGFAYLAAGEKGLGILDLTDPTHPADLGSLRLGNFQHIALSGSSLIASGPTGLTLLDLSVPEVPVPVGFLEAIGAPRAIAALGPLAAVVTDQGVLIVDVSHPSDPIILSQYQAGALVFDAAFLFPSTLLLAAGARGLVVLDLSAPGFPHEAGLPCPRW